MTPKTVSNESQVKQEPPERVMLWICCHCQRPRMIGLTCCDGCHNRLHDTIEYSHVSAEVAPVVDDALCLLCGHKGVAPDGTCMVPVPICSDDYHGTRRCGCRCKFRAAPAAPRDEAVCKCGLDKDDPIHSFSTEWQQMHAFMPRAATTPPSTLARKAAEEIREWLRTGDGEVDGNAINEVAAIIERCLSAERDVSPNIGAKG